MPPLLRRAAAAIFITLSLCAAAAARADVDATTYQGRVCRVDYGCEGTDGCYWTIALVVVVDGEQVPLPLLVACDPRFPAVVAVCSAVPPLQTCLTFKGPMLYTANGFLLLDARSAPLTLETDCAPRVNTFSPC